LGYITDITGKPEEDVNVPDPATLLSLIESLGSRYPEFKDTFIDPKTQKIVASRQILVTPGGKWTGPPSKGLETAVEEGMRVLFW